MAGCSNERNDAVSMTPAAAADQSIEGSSRWLTQTKNSQRADARSKASEEARDRSQPEYFRVPGQQRCERLQARFAFVGPTMFSAGHDLRLSAMPAIGSDAWPSSVIGRSLKPARSALFLYSYQSFSASTLLRPAASAYTG